MSDVRDPSRVSSRMLFLVSDLMRAHGQDIAPVIADLESFQGPLQPPDTISWDDYIEIVERVSQVIGGVPGIGSAMRSTIKTAYSELRALAGFFPGPVPFFLFVAHHLMLELSPGCLVRATVIGENKIRAIYTIQPGLRTSRTYNEGSVHLAQIFPMHFDLPEADVEVVQLDEQGCELVMTFPEVTEAVRWGAHMAAKEETSAADERLTSREQQVLTLVAGGMTNAQIAARLGTSPSTVKNQISTILTKMDAVNRTELASMAARQRQA